MTNAYNVNPYEAGASRRYAKRRIAETERGNYVQRQLDNLRFELGVDDLNPYDSRHVARMHQIFRSSRLYRR